MIATVLAISISLQVIAAVSALRLIPITGRRLGWVAIAAAITLMGIRRGITFLRLLSGDPNFQPDIAAELVALTISALMVVGLVWIAPLFLGIRKTNLKLERTNRALKTLSDCNKALIRMNDKANLMYEICRLIVQVGGYRSAWVGFAEQDRERTIQPEAEYGIERNYLEGIGLTWADVGPGSGPTGTTIRTGEPSIAQDVLTDPAFEGRREEAVARDYLSSVALPLSNNGDVFGALTIHSSEPEAFDAEEVRLLTELADDLAYGIIALRTREERNQAEQARLRSEERYENLFRTMREGFALHEIICDAKGNPIDYRFLEVNPAFEQMIGLKAEEVLDRRAKEVMPDLEEEWIRMFGEVALGGKTCAFESYFQELDKHYAVNAFSPRAGQFATIFLDITERVEAEQALRESEEHFRALTEGSLTGVYIIQDGVIRYANPGLSEIFGYNQEEIVDQLEAVELVHPDDRTLVAENIRRRIRGETQKIRYQFRGLRKDGTTIHCEVLGRRADYEGRPAVVGTLLDITDRMQYEKRIQRQVRRLSALREIDLAISASLDARVTFQVLLTQVTEQLSVDAADVLIYDRHSRTLNFEAGKGFHTDALQHTHLKLGEGHAGKAALDRQVVSVPDLSKEEDGLGPSPSLGEEGFVSYYAVPLVAKGTIQGVLEIFHRERLDPDREWIDFLEALAGQAAIAIDNATLLDELYQSNTDLQQAYDTTLEGWALALELRDIETEGHSQRVSDLTVKLARKMGLKGEDLVHARRGALLHDIGKMGVPDAILHKPGKLDEEEWEIMRKHPRYAHEMLSRINHLRPALDIPYCHHEKWDGSGYPRGLKGEEIPLAARIFAVVDVWDALRSDRPYRDAWDDEEALEYIKDESGQHFDPQIVEGFLELLQSQ